MPPALSPSVAGSASIEALSVFAVSLLVGGLAIHLAARYVTYRSHPGRLTVEHAVLTALVGAIVWAVLEWIPLVGSLLALIGWIGVIKYRYPGGWTKAGITGIAAWAAAVLVLAALEVVGVGTFSALGVPGA